MDRAKSWRKILSVLLIVACPSALGLYFARLPWPDWDGRPKNERGADADLRLIRDAEATFRHNDVDQNGVQDYWTGDVAGLLRFGLIERSLAEADTRPLVPLVPKPVPRNGYYFRALELDGSETPPEEYRQDTDGRSGKVHHPRKFAFIAYPAEPKVTGKYMFIINEDGSPFRSEASDPAPRDWPKDRVPHTTWSRAR